MSKFATRPSPILMLPTDAPPAPAAAAPVSLGPTDLDGAMASLDAFHRANGLPSVTARNAKAAPIRVPASPLAVAPIAATHSRQFDQARSRESMRRKMDRPLR